MRIIFEENDKVILEKSLTMVEDILPKGYRILHEPRWDLIKMVSEVEDIINDKQEI